MADNRIRELRKAARLSLHEVAGRCGTDASQIRKLEAGERQLTLAWMRRLGAALEVRPSALLLDDDAELRLTPEEREIVDTFRRLPPHLADQVLKIVRVFGDDAGDAPPAPAPAVEGPRVTRAAA